MANTIKGLTVEIGGDATKLGKALEDVNKKSRNLSSELGQINKLLKLDPGNAELLAQKQEVLAEAVETTSKKLATLKEAEAQVQAQFEKGEASAEQVRELQREIVATEKKLDSYEKAARETAEAVEKLGKAGKDQSLSKTVDEQRKKLADLKAEYVEVASSQGKHSKAAKELASQIKTLSGELSDNEKDLKEAEDAADKYDKTIKDAEKSSKSFGDTTESLGSKLANAAKVGLKAMAAAATAVVAALVGAAEATRDYREDMGKLEIAFTQNGYTAEQATRAYKELVGVLGESDQAVETANHLALLTDNAKDLATWTGDILPGVFATFGDSLPIEGLTEAANETAKVGQVTGPLADALNWAAAEGETYGVTLRANTEANKEWNKAVEAAASAEDYFNLALQECSTEQERQALITETLASLYGDAAEAYKETNAEVIRANQANDAWMESMAGIGAAFEPVMTDVKMLGASLLSDLVPGVEAVSEAFRGMMNGDEGAADALGDAIGGLITGLLGKVTELLPTIMEVGASIITTLATSLVQQVPALLATGGQILSNLLSGIAANLPNVMQSALDTIGGFVTGLQTNLPLVLEKGREILLTLALGIRRNLPDLVSQALDIIMNFAQTIYDNAPSLIATGIAVLTNLVQGIMQSLPTLIAKVPEIISTFANTINDNMPTILAKGVQLIWEIIKGIISAIPTLIANIPKIISAIVDVWEAFNWLNLGKKAITFLKNGINNMIGAVKTAGTNILDGVTNSLKSLPSKLLNIGKNAISDLGGALRNGLSTVKAGAATIFNGVLNYFKTLPSKLLNVGKDLVRGLWNGISDMAGWVIGKIKGFGESILSSIKGIFGVQSPSTEMAWIGEMLDEGLAEGLLDNIKDPVKAMQKVTTGVLGAADEVDGLTLTRQLQTSTAATTAAQLADIGILGKLDSILSAIERGQIITLDGEALVGATYERYDTKLGQRRTLAARGALA